MCQLSASESAQAMGRGSGERDFIRYLRNKISAVVRANLTRHPNLQYCVRLMLAERTGPVIFLADLQGSP
jgi:hypothetical protein